MAEPIRPHREKLAKDIGYLAGLSKAGYRSLYRGDLERAEHYFQQLLTIDPFNKYALTGMGEIEKRKNHPDKSIEHFQLCVDHHENDIPALKKLAEVFWETEKHEQAAFIWEQLRTLDSRDHMTLSHLGDVYRKLDKPKVAERMYLDCLELEKENRYGLNGIAQLYYDRGMYSEAIPFIHRLLRLDETNVKALTLLGNCFRNLNSFSEALATFQKAYDLDPANFYVLYGMADCYRGTHFPEESLKILKAILKGDPDNQKVLSRAGDASLSIGDITSAKRYYHRALKQGEDVYSVLGLSRIDQLNGDWGSALNRLENLSSNYPLNNRILTELCRFYIKIGYNERARDRLHTYLSEGGSRDDIVQIERMLED